MSGQASISRRAGPLMIARLAIAVVTIATPLVLARALDQGSYGTLFRDAVAKLAFVFTPVGGGRLPPLRAAGAMGRWVAPEASTRGILLLRAGQLLGDFQAARRPTAALSRWRR